MMRTAVIMAAGLGTRFGAKTEKIPKAFIEVSGKSMIIRSIEILIDCGIKRIIIGTGYKKEYFEELKEKYPQIECCFSKDYAKTNSMYTLYNLQEVIGNDDFILLESDLVFEKKAIISLMKNKHENIMLITPVMKFQDQYYVEYDENGNLKDCSTDKTAIDPNGELVGIHKLSNKFYNLMCEEYSKIIHDKPKLGYEYQLLFMSQQILPLFVLKEDNLIWYEIDDEDDLNYAEKNIMTKMEG